MTSSPRTDVDPEVRTRIRQQEVVAELGQQALETDDLDQLMHDASVAVAKTLDNEYAKVLELLPGDDEVFLRQGVGWQDGVVGNATVPTDLDSQAGYTLLSEEPILVDDLRTEDRFSGPELLTDHDVVSGISVIIGSVENPWGVLGTHTTEQREFTQHDANFVQSVANVLAAAIEETKTKQRLDERESEFEKTFNRITDAFIGLDPSWEITYVNERGSEILDPEHQGLVGKNFWDPFEPALGTTFEEEYRKAMETQEPTSFEEYYPPLSMWFEVHAYPSESGLSIYFRDVSEQKEREQELELFRTLLDHSNDSVLVTDPDTGQFLDVNETACQQRGYSREELLQLSVPDVETEIADREEWQSFMKDLRSEDQVTFDGRHRRKDGTTFPVEVNVSLVKLEQEYVLAVARDVTERKKREKDLRETKRQLELATKAASVGLWTWDIRENVVTADEYLAESYGIDPDEAVEGGPMEQFYEPILEEDTEQTWEQLERAVEETGELETEYRIRDAEGDVKWVVARGKVIYDNDGEPVRLNGAVTDITERKERERELERAHDLLDKTQRIADVGGWEIDPETKEVFWTKQIFDLLEVPDDEEPSIDEAIDMYHEDDQSIVETALEEALDTAEPFDVEVRIRTHGDEIRWLRLQGVPEVDDDGDVVSFRGAAQDITGRKERERELETLFEVLPVGVVVAEADGEIIEANDTAHQIWGGDVFDANSVEEYERYPVQWADSGERVPPEEMTLARVLDGEEVTEPDIFEIEAADDEHRIVELQGMPIRNDTGDVIRGVVTLSDITGRKEAQRQLAESERLYRTLAEHFPNGVVGVYDFDLRYSLAAGELIGDPAPSVKEVEGSRMPDLYPDEVVEDLEPLFRAAIEDGETGSTRATVVGRRWQVWATPLRDANGEIFAGLSFAQDITKQIEREEKLAELVEKLEESNERLEQFAYAASHDLQEPLRMVSSYLQLLESRHSDDFDDDAEEFLEFAVDGADRMRDMIDGLLEYSRVDTLGDPLEPVDLDHLVAEVQEDLQIQIAESGAQITTQDLPHVEGDDSQLRQVFQNLFSNAITYSGDKKPKVHVEADRRGQKWEISIHDNGVGIDPDDQDRVFKVFQRLHSREEHSGTGIGLALCQRIVERHGGRIRVDSEPGEGSTFSFTLPAVE
ncbi:PAS domain S-box protein [Natrinema sp. LN54]|uniref:PAS domain S-box protein n=1 Tax=Natrinema sp. LN54 TaxID=3458705 RepID=UPI004035221D